MNQHSVAKRRGPIRAPFPGPPLRCRPSALLTQQGSSHIRAPPPGPLRRLRPEHVRLRDRQLRLHRNGDTGSSAADASIPKSRKPLGFEHASFEAVCPSALEICFFRNSDAEGVSKWTAEEESAHYALRSNGDLRASEPRRFR